MVDRYPVNNFVVVGRDCKNPEAVFKMMYWSFTVYAGKQQSRKDRML